MARFLIDEDLPRAVAAATAAQGVDVIHMTNIGLRGQADPDVLASAVSQGRALVSADKEFGNVLLYPPADHLGVVLVRISEELDPDYRIQRVVDALVSLSDDDLKAIIVVVEPARLRIRKMPT